MYARWTLVGMIGLALLTEQPATAGVPIFGRTSSGQLVVIDLSPDWLGKGQIPVRGANGESPLDVTAVQALPSIDLTRTDAGEVALIDLVTLVITDLLGPDAGLAAGLGGGTDPAQPGAPAATDPLAGLVNPGDGGGGGDTGQTAPPLSGSGDPWAPSSTGNAGTSFRVKATAEGLIGGTTATGEVLGKWTEGAALPSRSVLGRELAIVLESTGVTIQCPVIDVGPWNTNDVYWDRPDGRPQAASGRDMSGRRTNGAGIDITDAGWYRLLALRTFDRRLLENESGIVDWSFASQNG